MAGIGPDPLALLAHARRLRESIGADRLPEMDALIAGLEVDVDRAR
jgi:hypothetical protein